MASSDSQKNNSQNNPRGNSRAALTIVGALALAGLAYAIARVDILRARITTLRITTEAMQQSNQQLQAQLAELQATGTRRTAHLNQLQGELTSLKEQLGDARNGLAPVQQQWARIEATYLLRLTQDQLQLAHDVPGATQSLAAVLNTLAADDDLIILHQQLTQQLAELRALPVTEYAHSEQALQQAAQLISQLPLKSLTTDEAITAESGVARAWAILKHSMSSLIRVRRTDAATTLSTDAQALGRAHIHALLTDARLALRNHDQARYQTALTQAQLEVTAALDNQHAGVQDLLRQLQQLAQLNIAPALPDFSRSIQALRNSLPANATISTP